MSRYHIAIDTTSNANISLQYHEFDISDSQEPTQDDEAPARKRKASIANKSILV